MTKRRTTRNGANASNVTNGRSSYSSSERNSERENGDPKVLPANQELGPGRIERADFQGPERPGILTRGQITAIQAQRRKGRSIDWIHETTGLAKSTIHKHVKSIIPSGEDNNSENRPNPEQIAQYQRLRRQGMSNQELADIFKWPLETILESTKGIEPDPTIAVQQPSPPSAPAQPKLAYEVTTHDRPRILEDRDEAQNQNNGADSVGYEQNHPMVVQSNNGGSFNSVLDQQSHYTLAGQMALDKYTDINAWIKERMVPRLDSERYIRQWIPGESDEEFVENFKGIALDARTYRAKEARWDQEFREKTVREQEEKRNKP